MMLDHSLTMTRDGLNETRRAIQALRAAPLDDLGLRTALESLARASADRFGWGLSLELPEEISGISMEAEHCIYRIVEEALRNTGQHAGARRVELSLTRANGYVELTLHDDGRGFEYNPEALDDRYGLRGMLERAASIGAELEIVSRPGQGARLRMVLEAAS
jgi:signal transduction histidine kinase